MSTTESILPTKHPFAHESHLGSLAQHNAPIQHQTRPEAHITSEGHFPNSQDQQHLQQIQSVEHALPQHTELPPSHHGSKFMRLLHWNSFAHKNHSKQNHAEHATPADNQLSNTSLPDITPPLPMRSSSLPILTTSRRPKSKKSRKAKTPPDTPSRKYNPSAEEREQVLMPLKEFLRDQQSVHITHDHSNLYELKFSSGVTGYSKVSSTRLLLVNRHFTQDIFVNGCALLTLQHPSSWGLKEKMLVYSNGILLGRIEQPLMGSLKRMFRVLSETQEHIYTVYSPLLHPYHFYAEDLHGKCVAKICRKWYGLGRVDLENADCFQIKYCEKQQLSPEHKALLLAAVFLVISVYFDTKKLKLM